MVLSLASLAATTKGGGSALSAFLPFLILILVFFFFIIRPQRARQRQMVQVRQNLAPGAEVQTTFGLFATVVSVDSDVLVLEIAPGVHGRFTPSVVARVVTPVEPDVTVEPQGETTETSDGITSQDPPGARAAGDT